MVDQTQLALVGGVSTTPNVLGPLSREARSVLTRPGVPSADRISSILRSPALHAEIKAIAPDLVAAARPAGGTAVRLILMERVASVVGSPWDDDGVADVALREYETSLGEFPVEALHRGIDDFHKQPDARFFPRPGPLHELCAPHAYRIKAAAWLAKTAAERLATAAAPISKEDRAAEIERLKAEGILNPDGSVNLTMKKPPAPPARTGETRAEMADRTRRLAAELEARKAAPPSDEVIV